jgi:hypothetical protein
MELAHELRRGHRLGEWFASCRRPANKQSRTQAHLRNESFHLNASKPNGDSYMIALTVVPVFAAVGYSLVYLLAGGGLAGAVVIFFIAKLLGK